MPKQKVYYNLKESPLHYEVDGVTYYFATEIHYNKFVNGYEENRRLINTRLKSRYNIDICFNTLADLYFYTVLENKGFYINTPEGECEWLGQVRLTGETLMRKNLVEL